MAKKIIIYTTLCLFCFYFVGSIIWAEQAAPVENEKTEILIGAHLPLTGALAMVGTEQKWAYEKAVEDINNAGGIYLKQHGEKLPVRLIVMDDQTNPKKAAEVVEHLITKERVDFILSGHSAAYGVLPGMVVAEEHKKYYHGSVIWVPDFLNYNFKYCTMYFFDIAQGCAMPFEVWNTFPEKDRPQKVALFLEDTFDGKQFGEISATTAKKYGYTIALWESINPESEDFTPQIAKAKSMDIDAIILLSNTEYAIKLLKQMKELDFSVKFLQGIKGTWAADFYEALGNDADYVFCDGFWSMDFPFNGAKELGQQFHKESGKYSISAGMYYALCQVLFQAIEKAGTLDSTEVRQAVLDNEFDTVMGKVNYDEKGVALFPLANFQWWKGKQHLVYPVEHAKFNVRIAPPWDKRLRIADSTSK